MSSVVENKSKLNMSANKKMIVEEEVEETYEEEVEEEEEEEVSKSSSIEDELAEAERIANEAVEKLKALKAKKAMDTHKTAIAERLKERYTKNLVYINEQIAKFEKDKAEMEERIETLEGADETDLLDLLASSDYFEDADNELSHLTTGAPRDMFASLVAEAVNQPIISYNPNTEGKKKGTRTAIDRKAYPSMLLDKMVFIATGNMKGTKDKISLSVIFNAQDKCFYRYDKKKMTKYPTLQDANREWCGMRGYDKLGNAWEDFKALNLKDKKETRSIHNLHNQNWIADSISGARDFIDAKWNW